MLASLSALGQSGFCANISPSTLLFSLSQLYQLEYMNAITKIKGAEVAFAFSGASLCHSLYPRGQSRETSGNPAGLIRDLDSSLGNAYVLHTTDKKES